MATVLITGGHNGLGLACAKKLAGGAHLNLLLAGRDLRRVETAAKQLKSDYGVAVGTVELDLNSFDSVRAAALEVRTRVGNGQIDSLQSILLNAGAQFHGPVSYSKEGYEETFATNCLGNFLLLNLLLDCVADNGRIVFTASGTHDPDTMDGKMVGKAVEPDAFALANNGKGGKALSGGTRYSTSKLCTILYAYELNRRLQHAGVSVASITFDPGLIPETGLARTAPKLLQQLLKTSLMKWVLQSTGTTMGSLPFSGAALARVVANPEFADASGKYIQSKNGTLLTRRSSKMSYDEDRASKLWNDSERLVHLKTSERPNRLT